MVFGSKWYVLPKIKGLPGLHHRNLKPHHHHHPRFPLSFAAQDLSIWSSMIDNCKWFKSSTNYPQFFVWGGVWMEGGGKRTRKENWDLNQYAVYSIKGSFKSWAEKTQFILKGSKCENFFSSSLHFLKQHLPPLPFLLLLVAIGNILLIISWNFHQLGSEVAFMFSDLHSYACPSVDFPFLMFYQWWEECHSMF